MIKYIEHLLKLMHNEEFHEDIFKLRNKWLKSMNDSLDNIEPMPPVNFDKVNKYLYSDEILGFTDVEAPEDSKELIAGYKDKNNNWIYLDNSASNNETSKLLNSLLEKWQFDFINSSRSFLSPDFINSSDPLYFFMNACCVFKIDSIIDPRKFFKIKDYELIQKKEVKSVKRKLKRLRLIEKMLKKDDLSKEDIQEKLKNEEINIVEPSSPIFLYRGALPSKKRWGKIYDSIESKYKNIGSNKTIENLIENRYIYISKKTTAKTYKEIAKELLKKNGEKNISERRLQTEENKITKRMASYCKYLDIDK